MDAKKMLKKALLLIIFISIFCFAQGRVSFVFAQTVSSNQVITRVGDAPEDQKPVVSPTPGATSQPGGPVQGILDWASQITSGLARGLWGYLNRLGSAISNGTYSSGTWAGASEGTVYWCTYLIIDSYNLSGYGGLAKANHAAVVNMRQWWRTTGVQNGYKYVAYSGDPGSLINVAPGYAMFMESSEGRHTGSEHVNLVKEISLDSHGNGKIVTLDSNSSSTGHTYPVTGYLIRNVPYPVRGFGGI